ncbi:MAG: biopolymer transport protein ExbD [Lentisphaerae bacterium ADurb.BinA184]|nr:MAG: biopolymer transport protein ExbD [Lentisphaerae bacterium ADurb.BinA184]
MTRTTLKIHAGEFDAIPFLNLFFLLLIFFIISSSLVFQPGIPVNLPVAPASDTRSAERLVVTITASNLLFFNDAPVAWEELERQLRELVLTSRQFMARRAGAGGADLPPVVVLRADARVPYDNIVRVMSLARSLKLGVYLVTDPGSAPAGPARQRP